MNARTLPAFGRELMARRLSGAVPRSRTVAIVDAWDRGGNFAPWRVVIKAGQDPAAVDLGFVAGIDVLILAEDVARVQSIAVEAKRYRARLVAGIAYGPGVIVAIP